MPGYKTHLAGGGVLGGGLLAILAGTPFFQPDPLMGACLLAVVLLGALFPDTDTDSKGQNLFYGWLVVMDLALMIQGQYKWAAVLGFCAMLPAIGRHRGWTHTWWAMLVVPLPIIILPMAFYRTAPELMLPFYAAAVTGYFSHLLLDRKF